MARKKLSQEKLDYYEELIRKELEESMRYIDNVSREQSIGARESSGDLSSYAYHQADQGSDTNLMEHTAKMMDSERKKIRLLNDAMRRIQDGVFGVCDMCGEIIPDARLEIIPYALQCIECKEKMEDKKRRKRR
ncbi:MAG: hypothetical protein GX106_06025 [Candidatus Cloacimonetes bacterium]|jgi:RNA polymerase-binding transcription factor DksA|nr:hypothetical protein [Candidatus Cloacimonadota bacterium]